MKQKYVKPKVNVKNITSENDTMYIEMSIPIYDGELDSEITDGSQILVTEHSVWEEG